MTYRDVAEGIDFKGEGMALGRPLVKEQKMIDRV